MTSFYVVRHGNTFYANEQPVRIGAATDLALTETGERQSRMLGEWFAKSGVTFQRVLAGPLKRTQRTAELIMASQPASPMIETAQWLTEIDHGEDEGKTDDLITARAGAATLHAWDEHGVAPPGWHVAPEARLAAWRSLLVHQHADNVLLVTSNGAARFALLACVGRRPSSLKLRTGAFGRIVGSSSAPARVDIWDVRPPDDRQTGA